MGKVSIQEIASKLIAQNGLSKKEATLFVNMMFDVIREALERDKMVKVKGLGTFKIIDVESRESVNVNTGERVLIEGHNKITFTPDALMKELVNKPFSQFETVVLNDGVDFKEPKEEETSDIDEGENDMAGMPLVDFIAHDPISLGTPVEPEKPVAPVVSETSVIPETPVIPEAPAVPETPVVSEAPVVSEIPVVPEVPKTLEIQDTQETPAKPETENPELQEEPVEESSTDESPADESPVEDEYVAEEGESVVGGMKRPMVLLACLISLLVGYLLGNYLPWNRQTEPTEVPAPKTEKAKEVPVQKPDAKQPEAKVEAPAEKSVPSEEKTDKPVAAPIEKPKSEAVKTPEVQKPAEAPKQQPVATVPAEEKLDKYEAMDARVRTGAYRIIGLGHKEKVKEGDNLLRITKRTLGPGMECYIEVYNGLTATSQLKKGQEIKIPKVERKKKKTPQN